MSLINEALKRARQAQGQHVTVAAQEPALQPVVQQDRQTTAPAWLRPLAATIILALGLCSIGLWWRSARTTAAPAVVRDEAAESAQAAAAIAAAFAAKAAKTAPPPVTPAPPSAPPESRRSPEHAATLPAPSPSAHTVSASAVDSAPPTVAAAGADSPDQTVERPAANFRLQGIFFRLNNASAIINNQTVFVGDEIEGARVLTIERYSVTLRIGGKPQVFKLR